MNFIIHHNVDSIVRYILGTILLALSLWFVFSPDSMEGFKKFEQPDSVRVVLGCGEAIVSVLFILYRTRIIGAIGLLLVFGFAAYLHLNVGLSAYGLIPWTIGILFVLYVDWKRRTIDSETGETTATTSTDASH